MTEDNLSGKLVFIICYRSTGTRWQPVLGVTMCQLNDCLQHEHHHGLLLLAVFICVSGSCLTALIARRIVVSVRERKQIQIFLSAVIGGSTIWSTHFLAMLAFEPRYPHGYDAILTVVSLLVAVSGLFVSNFLLGFVSSSRNYVFGGTAFGLTVSAMHYVGMSAYELPGLIVWNPLIVVASVVLGASFGVAAYHRLVFPITRYCWIGGAVLLVLAICAMHFTGMAAFALDPDPLVVVPESTMSDTTLSVFIFSVTLILYALGYIGVRLEEGADIDANAKVEATANVDTLTQLPNRSGLINHISACKLLLETDRTLKVAVLTIDLDRFKEVNDLYGHTAGDAVLTHVSHRFSEALTEGEFIARSGGDEFVAIKKGFRRIEEVMTFATRLNAAFTEEIDIPAASVFIGGSIGIAATIEHGFDLDSLLQKSDIAMYRAKADPDRNTVVFDAEMGQINRERLLLIHDLRHAIERNEFELVYQIQNNATSRAPSGFEVLLRWNHATRGRISPADFIPLAEETGLIREIGLWVLRTACLEAASWAKQYSVAVNVAPQQLVQSSFLEDLSDVLLESGLDPELLELEVTEASIIDDQEYTLKVMHKIKEMGVCIAMDDFGTGYSSLATLQAFPFDKIKIDRSFVQDVHLNKQRAAIVRATLLLGDALEIPILAEGVEIEDELAFLDREQCMYVQGFLFGMPLSLAEVRDFTRNTEMISASENRTAG